MKIFGRRMIRSEQQLAPPKLLHATKRHSLARTLTFYAVGYPPQLRKHRPNERATPRVRLIITSQVCDDRYPYHAIEMHFSADEARTLEAQLAQALGTRRTRSNLRPLTRLTKQQARKRLI